MFYYNITFKSYETLFSSKEKLEIGQLKSQEITTQFTFTTAELWICAQICTYFILSRNIQETAM